MDAARAAWRRILGLLDSFLMSLSTSLTLLGSTLQACRAVTAERSTYFVWKKNYIARARKSFPTPCRASTDSNYKAVSTWPTRALDHRDRGWSLGKNLN